MGGTGTPATFTLEEAAQRYPQAHRITRHSLAGDPVYRVQTGAETLLLDAQTAELLSPLERETIAEVAAYHYAGKGAIERVELIENNPPSEIRFTQLPVWRVDFDDGWGSSFYIDPDSGRFITRRHTLWRVFDFLWMLHIMDYDEREDINNTVLQIVSVAGVSLGLSGIWLLFYSFRRNRGSQDAV